MTIYSINHGIGWASSGVEYAQAYRARILRELAIPAKFIFTDMFQSENLQHFTSAIGFKDDEIIWLYGAFTDIRVAPTSFSLSQLEATFTSAVSKREENDAIIRYHFENDDFYINAARCRHDKGAVQRVEYVAKGKLIRKDYYSYTRIFSEYYAPDEHQPRLYQRTFFNEDGSAAYEELIQGKSSIYRFPDRLLFSKADLVAYLLEKLELRAEDMILLDRSTGIGQAVFQGRGAARLAVVIHAEHYSVKGTDENNILWNNYYEYQFTHADKVDAFITSTVKQKTVLEEQFAAYTPYRPKVYAIPVGSLEHLHYPKHRQPYSLMTGSRLAGEKHIDWLISAVIRAHEQLPQLTFDIYGEGGERSKLTQLIEEGNAGDYIALKGHQDLADIYQQYDVYLSASTSEGFGLTLLEALGSGLPLIGLDVPYGNQTFIENGQNGYLIPRQEPDDSEQMASAFADKILDYYRQADQAASHSHSYEIARGFLHENLMKQWRRLYEEVGHDKII